MLEGPKLFPVLLLFSSIFFAFFHFSGHEGSSSSSSSSRAAAAEQQHQQLKRRRWSAAAHHLSSCCVVTSRRVTDRYCPLAPKRPHIVSSAAFVSSWSPVFVAGSLMGAGGSVEAGAGAALTKKQLKDAVSGTHFTEQEIVTLYEHFKAISSSELDDGVIDGLFRFTQPVSGAYYWCPPVHDGRLDLRALKASG